MLCFYYIPGKTWVWAFNMLIYFSQVLNSETYNFRSRRLKSILRKRESQIMKENKLLKKNSIEDMERLFVSIS